MSFIRQTLHDELADIKKDDKFEFRDGTFSSRSNEKLQVSCAFSLTH
jgi:hypothetical protein